jgi:uncharacterized membrane protein
MKTNSSQARLAIIDIWRGILLVIISLLMLWYFSGNNIEAEFWTQKKISSLPSIQFWLSLVTSLAIPSIYILLGVSIILYAKNKKWESWNTAKITRSLATRGIFLIALQLFIENPLRLLANFQINGLNLHQVNTGFEFYSSNIIYFGILSSLGTSLIFWSVFTKVRSKQIIAISVLLMGLGWFIINLKGLSNVNEAFYFRLLALPGFSIPIKVGFPLLPWLGLPGLGIVLGRYYRKKPLKTFKITSFIALGSFLLFLTLRWNNWYSDFSDKEIGLIGFFNFSRFPPSISYILLSISFGLLLLYLSYLTVGKRTMLRDALIVYGGSPLLFYLCQLFLFGIAGLFIDFSNSPVITILTWVVMLLIILPILDYFENNFKASKNETLWNYF